MNPDELTGATTSPPRSRTDPIQSALGLFELKRA
jgi:hypothetical protein